MIIDKGGMSSGIDADEGELNAEIEADTKADDIINEPSGDADLNRGAKTGKASGDVEPKEGEVGEGEEVSEEESINPQDLIKNLSAKVEDLQRRLDNPQRAPKVEEKAPEPAPISDQEWEKYESEWGIPRTAIKNTVDRVVRAVTDIRSYVDQKFAKYERQEQLDSLSSDPEFNDAKKYSKEINQYLEKIDPRYHSNPDVLKDAVIWARGLNYKRSVQNVRNEKEINKRISGIARPASSSVSRGSKGKTSASLTTLEKSAADAVNMPYEEYAALKGKGRVIAL